MEVVVHNARALAHFIKPGTRHFHFPHRENLQSLTSFLFQILIDGLRLYDASLCLIS
uniref:Predicted protein n=1 Tax=Hordeum vulgare subsp. vulgare TaxID=112509 RepID=F2CZR6_HORVV|nr:predicted protein [Hordeum vulgare subsp. vulgare]